MTPVAKTPGQGRGNPPEQGDPDEGQDGGNQRLAALATQERVDAVLVACDVFGAQTVSARTIRRLLNALADSAGPWVMIPGNHDAARRREAGR